MTHSLTEVSFPMKLYVRWKEKILRRCVGERRRSKSTFSADLRIEIQ